MSDSPIAQSTLQALAGAPATLQGLLGGLTADVVETSPDEGWSPKDVVAHMLAVEGPAFRERIAIITAGGDPVVPEIDENAVLEASGYRARSLSELLNEFRRRRAENVRWLRGLDGEVLARTGRHEQVGEVTAANIVHQIAYHDLVHIEQLTKLLQPRLQERRGAMHAAF